MNRKPALTDKTVDLLRNLAGYAEAESDVISDGTEDQRQDAKDIRAACDWIRRLCIWHDQRKESKPGR